MQDRQPKSLGFRLTPPLCGGALVKGGLAADVY
jgi:hypothetical protein